MTKDEARDYLNNQRTTILQRAAVWAYIEKAQDVLDITHDAATGDITVNMSGSTARQSTVFRSNGSRFVRIKHMEYEHLRVNGFPSASTENCLATEH